MRLKQLIGNSIQFIFMLLIQFYRYVITPLKPPTCRYHPSCSEYALEALKIHGGFYGSWLMIKRLLRCHPWGGHGYDPVPKKK